MNRAEYGQLVDSAIAKRTGSAGFLPHSPTGMESVQQELASRII